MYTISGGQTGQGIAVDASGASDASLTVDTDDISGFQKNGIDAVNGNSVAASATGTVTVSVLNGSITGAGATTAIAQNGVLTWDLGGGTVTGSVDGTTISGLDYTNAATNPATSAGVLAYGDGSITTVHNASFIGDSNNANFNISNSNSTASSTDATRNYWGSAAGPATSTLDGNVTFSPWYVNASKTTLSSPTLTLNGPATISIGAGDVYTDAGATGFDSVNNATTTVTATGNVDTATPGTYTLTYNFTDSQGHTATPVTRTVTVFSQASGGGGGGGGGSTTTTGNTTTTTTSTPGSTTTTTSTGTGQVLGASTFNFTSDLTVGATGDAVTALQQILINDGYLQIAAPTGFFGPLTQAAVMLYQAANGIPNTGFVGPLTLASLNVGTITTASGEARAIAIQNIKNALPGILTTIQNIQAELNALIASGAIN